jgi:hypothetical protein
MSEAEAKKGLTEEQVADLKEAFAMFDINGDGMLCSFFSVVSRGQVILDQQVGFLGSGLAFVTWLCLCVHVHFRLNERCDAIDPFLPNAMQRILCTHVILFDSTILSRLICYSTIHQDCMNSVLSFLTICSCFPITSSCSSITTTWSQSHHQHPALLS